MNTYRVLLTGGARGIGSAIKEKLESYDCYKVIAPTRDELALDNRASIANYFAKPEHCAIDILINNAGINIVKEIEDITDEDIDSLNQINVVAPLKLIQAVVPHMKQQQRGRIVNITSIWGERSIERRTLYSTSKFGLLGQTKALARELGPHNILINGLAPGFTATELTFRVLNKQAIENFSKDIPLRRFADPSEIATTVQYLISEENTYLTGQNIVVDGGFLA